MELSDDKKMEEALRIYAEQNNPIYHIPIDMGINEFKRRVATLPKKLRVQLTKAYKKRAWIEFESMSKGRGTFPSFVSRVQKKIPIIGESIEHVIGVRHGKRK